MSSDTCGQIRRTQSVRRQQLRQRLGAALALSLCLLGGCRPGSASNAAPSDVTIGANGNTPMPTVSSTPASSFKSVGPSPFTPPSPGNNPSHASGDLLAVLPPDTGFLPPTGLFPPTTNHSPDTTQKSPGTQNNPSTKDNPSDTTPNSLGTPPSGQGGIVLPGSPPSPPGNSPSSPSSNDNPPGGPASPGVPSPPIAPVPEPGALALWIGAGLSGLLWRRRAGRRLRRV